MITQEKTIIYLKRNQLEIVKVGLGLTKKILIKAEVPWNKTNIVAILKDIHNTFKTKSVKVLIDTDICYSLIIDWNKTEDPTRKEIQSIAEVKIPDHLENAWWDYKLLITNEGKKILFFAPVVEIYHQFIEAFKEVELEHEGSYPLEFLPKTENDFITFAQIGLEGKDEETLGVKPEVEELSEPKDEQSEKPILEPKEQKSKLPMLLGALVFLILALVIVLITKKPKTSLVTPIAEPTIAVAPTEEDINLEDYSVMILNSTKTSGLAEEVDTVLKAEGFEVTSTGNATEEVKLSQIAIKKDVPDKVYAEIIRALNSDFDFENEPLELEEESQYHIIVTLGEGKETAQ